MPPRKRPQNAAAPSNHRKVKQKEYEGNRPERERKTMSMQKYNDLVARAENAEMQLEDASRHVLRLQTRAESAETRQEEARFLLAEAARAEAAEIQCAETARMSLADLETRALAAQSEAARLSRKITFLENVRDWVSSNTSQICTSSLNRLKLPHWLLVEGKRV